MLGVEFLMSDIQLLCRILDVVTTWLLAYD